MVVLEIQLAGWGSKLPQLFKNGSFYSPQNFRLIQIVSDPRTWVATGWTGMLVHICSGYWKWRKWSAEMKTNLRGLHPNLTTYFLSFQPMNIPQHQLVAMHWEANTAASLILKETIPSNNFVVIRYEDLMDKPVEIAREVYSFIGLPFSMNIEFNVLQQTKSKLFCGGLRPKGAVL